MNLDNYRRASKILSIIIILLLLILVVLRLRYNETPFIMIIGVSLLCISKCLVDIYILQQNDE